MLFMRKPNKQSEKQHGIQIIYVYFIQWFADWNWCVNASESVCVCVCNIRTVDQTNINNNNRKWCKRNFVSDDEDDRQGCANDLYYVPAFSLSLSHARWMRRKTMKCKATQQQKYNNCRKRLICCAGFVAIDNANYNKRTKYKIHNRLKIK